MTLHVVTFDFTLWDWCSFLFPIRKHRMRQISNLNAVAQTSLSLYIHTSSLFLTRCFKSRPHAALFSCRREDTGFVEESSQLYTIEEQTLVSSCTHLTPVLCSLSRSVLCLRD